MRILLFSCSYAPRAGGLETVTRRLARELSDRGHVVVVATNRYPRILPTYENIDNVPVHRQLYPGILPTPNGDGIARKWKDIALVPLVPLVFFRLWRLTRSMQPDVVNIHYFSYPAVYMLLVAWARRIPVVFSFHGSDLSAVPYPANYERSLRWAARLAAAYTVCSHDLGRYLKGQLTLEQQRRVIVAYNGVDCIEGVPAEVEVPDTYLLVLSRLVKKKGVDVAIRAIALLSQRGASVHLVIAGDGPQRSELTRLIETLKIAAIVTMPGAVDHATARALVQRALFVVIPSYWEAFGMVCLEAMISGKAVVASRTGGIPEIVLDGTTGLLVEPGDPERLADAISYLLLEPNTAAYMGKNGQMRARCDFTWARMTEQYENAYRIACDRK